MIDEIKDTDSVSTDVKTDKKSELTKNSAIIILSILIFLLLIYIVFSKIIDSRKNEIIFEINSTVYETTEQTITSEFMININTDNPFELMQLPGIGSTKADAIIEYRKENGDFYSIDELIKVNGIGESTFEKIKNMIYVE